MFGRPFVAVRADFGRSRCRGWVREGRVRPRTVPRGPWVIWEPFLEFCDFGKIFQNVTLIGLKLVFRPIGFENIETRIAVRRPLQMSFQQQG